MSEKPLSPEAQESPVEHNLNLMKSEMMHALSTNESIGGNAGRVEINGKRYMAVAVNAYVDKVNGRIHLFSNELYEGSKPHPAHITFRIAVNTTNLLNADIFWKITDIGGLKDVGSLAEANLKESTRLWNETRRAPKI